MIKKGADYNTTSNFGEGRKTLPAGGYVCRILQAEETQDKNGRPLIHIGFDIIDGEFNNHFMSLYRSRKDNSDTPETVKWPFEGQAWISVYDYENPQKTSTKFKGFCTAVEQSGTQVWSTSEDFLTANLRNATVGVVFQRQEKEYNGKTYWRTVPWGFRSVDVIDSGEYYVPKDKPLNNTNGNGYGGYSNYGNQPQENFNAYGSVVNDLPIPNNNGADSFSKLEEDLPFK